MSTAVPDPRSTRTEAMGTHTDPLTSRSDTGASVYTDTTTRTDTGGRPEPSLRSVGELLGDISSDLSTLVRQEIALAKAEVKQSATDAGAGVGMLVAAGIAGFFVLMFLSVSAWWALGNAIGRGWSALVVALVWALIAGILAAVGRSRLKRVPPIAPRTTETAARIPDAMKGHES